MNKPAPAPQHHGDFMLAACMAEGALRTYIHSLSDEQLERARVEASELTRDNGPWQAYRCRELIQAVIDDELLVRHPPGNRLAFVAETMFHDPRRVPR